MSSEQEADQREHTKEPAPKVTFWTIVRSTLAAAIGVQNRANRERDFEHGTPGAFIAAGIIFTVAFVAILGGVVYMVIRSASG